VKDLPGGDIFRDHMNALEAAELQLEAVSVFFGEMAERMERMPQAELCREGSKALETME
jgi:tRNA-dihydrouridine synthase B